MMLVLIFSFVMNSEDEDEDEEGDDDGELVSWCAIFCRNEAELRLEGETVQLVATNSSDTEIPC
jgi:hypothetical protein